MAALGEKPLHLRINRFRLVTEAEEHFRAAELLALLDDAENLVDRHRFRAWLLRRFAKRAIAAEIPAEIGQWHEDLRREGHHAPFVPIAQLGRSREQCGQLFAIGRNERERIAAAELCAF